MARSVISLQHTKVFTFLFALNLMSLSTIVQGQIYSGQKGLVKLKGEAPNETITAESTTLVGKLDVTSRRFNFKQPLNSFTFSQGDLQKKHAEESYWEISRYPSATFSGEIINDFVITKNGEQNVTVKGKFTMHGVEKELKIPGVIRVENNTITITSKFSVYFSDYNIKIPRLVSLKVAQEFTVDLTLTMNKL
jgi:polyisoprenoid-binding protein YceI